METRIQAAPCSKPSLIDGSLRIGHFSESFHPVQNGVTTSLLTLVRELRACGHKVWIFAPAHQEQPEREVNVLRFPSFVSAFNREYPLAYPFYPRLALTTHFSRLRLNVVHTHTPFVLGLTGANLAIRRSTPLVTTFHTLYSRYSHYMPLLPDTVTQNLIEHYLPWYYNRCTEIICPSQIASEALLAMGVEQPIEVIPTGVPLPAPELISVDAAAALRNELEIRPDTPVLLYAGRLAPEKNIPWLLEVFARVLVEEPRSLLLIAGGGPIQPDLEAHAESLGIAANVRWLGPVPRRKMDTFYAAADVFCFPSPSETQGLVIGEARAAGLPCVVVDAGGAPELVVDGEDGYRIPPDDSDLFTARVLELLGNRHLRETMRKQARQNAVLYTPERMVERVLTVYDRAMSAPPRSRWLRHSSVEEELEWEAVGQSIREHVRPS